MFIWAAFPFDNYNSDVEENLGLVIDESDEGDEALKLINVTVYVNVIFMWRCFLVVWRLGMIILEKLLSHLSFYFEF